MQLTDIIENTTDLQLAQMIDNLNTIEHFKFLDKNLFKGYESYIESLLMDKGSQLDFYYMLLFEAMNRFIKQHLKIAQK
jgi:hypothetical protein